MSNILQVTNPVNDNGRNVINTQTKNLTESQQLQNPVDPTRVVRERLFLLPYSLLRDGAGKTADDGKRRQLRQTDASQDAVSIGHETICQAFGQRNGKGGFLPCGR